MKKRKLVKSGKNRKIRFLASALAAGIALSVLAPHAARADSWQLDSSNGRYWIQPSDGSAYPRSSWVSMGDTWYYMDEGGYMVTGWQNIGGVWYYLHDSGAMACSEWVDGYWLSADGVLRYPATASWMQDATGWYYEDTTGWYATGWQYINGYWYYFDTNGYMVTGWQDIGGLWYWFYDSGAMAENQWIGNYYLGAGGVMAASQWIGNYYVGADGLWQPDVVKQDTIEYDSAFASIESDVWVNGSGSGYHGKIDMISQANGVIASFGIQSESQGFVQNHPNAVYGQSFLIEYVYANAAQAGSSGKQYIFFGTPVPGTTYRLRLSWYPDGSLCAYVDGQLVQTVQTSMDGSQGFLFACEGSARRNGDTVDAYFSNTKVKQEQNILGSAGMTQNWGFHPENFFGIYGSVTKQGQVVSGGVAEDGTSVGAGFNSYGYPSYGADIHIAGTAAINPSYDWDTSFQITEPGSGTTGHPLSALVNIG